MPRHPRLFIPEATYRVYCRVARGEFVFDDPFEAAEFVSAVREVRDLHGWRIFAWTLMANHYHLVIKTGAIPLWRSMLRLQSEVARAFNISVPGETFLTFLRCAAKRGRREAGRSNKVKKVSPGTVSFQATVGSRGG